MYCFLSFSLRKSFFIKYLHFLMTVARGISVMSDIDIALTPAEAPEPVIRFSLKDL